MSAESITADAVAGAPPGEAAAEQTLTLAIENMHCGGCLRSVENAVQAVPGVERARANLSAKRVTAVYDPSSCDEAAVIHALDNAGFKSAPMAMQTGSEAEARDRDFLKRVAVAGFATANIMLLSVSVWSGTGGDMDEVTKSLFHRLSALIALPTVAYAGQPFFRSAIGALKAKRLNMDVPISLAILLATSMSLYQTYRETEQVYFDAAVMLLFFLLIGRWLDQRLRTRAHGEAQNLLSLQGGLATVLAPDGAQRSVPAHTLEAGDVVLVAAGDRIPADGVLLSDAAHLDQSLITGESDPADLASGDAAYAGTLNLGQAFTLKVTAADDMTLLAEIGRLMANAEQGRAKYRRLADRAARIYSPVVHILGAATFIGWMMLGIGWETALTYAIAVLIITCPCALALAVPAVQIAAASRLFRNGVLLKSADALERLAEIDGVVFDKTGTLTLGQPVLLNGDEIGDATLREAASLALASRHPYSRAIVDAARDRLGMVTLAGDVEEETGLGLRRAGPEGEQRLGSADWCGAGDAADAASVWFRSSDGTLTAFKFSDRLRSDADDVVSRLEEDGLAVSLLSGDRIPAVDAAAKTVGIRDWHGALKPAEKIDFLKKWASDRKLLMVGDGLNDAPALAEAHVSISPARAADITQRAADLVFQGERLAPIERAIDIARRARSMAHQNIGVALAYNVVCVPLAVCGYVTPLVAAIAMSTSSILVTANALRLAKPGAETAS